MSGLPDKQQWGKFSEAVEAELPEYRALSGLAVVGFALGLLSALAFVQVRLCFVSAAAAICCAVALVRISRAPSEISGRWLALIGLVLAVFWTVAGVARELTEQRLLDIHSRPFAQLWFDYLKKGEPEKALEMSRDPLGRRPLDAKLQGHYLSTNSDYEDLEQFVSQPDVRALLALGEKAQVRHYLCEGAGGGHVSQVFAVTYDDRGTKKSFFVRINLIRKKYPDQGAFAWQTGSTEAPWIPLNSAQPAG